MVNFAIGGEAPIKYQETASSFSCFSNNLRGSIKVSMLAINNRLKPAALARCKTLSQVVTFPKFEPTWNFFGVDLRHIGQDWFDLLIACRNPSHHDVVIIIWLLIWSLRINELPCFSLRRRLVPLFQSNLVYRAVSWQYIDSEYQQTYGMYTVYISILLVFYRLHQNADSCSLFQNRWRLY